MMKLKGIELNGTYEIEFGDTWFEVYDSKGNTIYLENSDGGWSKSKFDEKNNRIYYDSSYGYWAKWEYNESGNMIYYENSSGYIIDKRVKELTFEEIKKSLGYKIKIKGE